MKTDTPTPRTENETGKPNGNHAVVYAAFARQLERELTAVTEQRDDFNKELEIANLRLKGKRHPDDNGIMGDGEIDVKEITEQRDRLAEALQKLADCDWVITPHDRMDGVRAIAKEALVAVKGGSNEIPR